MKNLKLIALLCMLGLAFASCNKEKSEWRNYYGFTAQELYGSYTNSNVEGAFEGLTESDLCRICRDAQINIGSVGGNTQFEVKSAGYGLSVAFKGTMAMGDDTFLIHMSEHAYELTAYVYTNQAKQIRIHGFVRKHDGNGLVNYYFDVIKN